MYESFECNCENFFGGYSEDEIVCLVFDFEIGEVFYFMEHDLELLGGTFQVESVPIVCLKGFQFGLVKVSMKVNGGLTFVFLVVFSRGVGCFNVHNILFDVLYQTV